MGTIAASAVLSTVSTLIQDTTNVRWPQAELLTYLNDGQREVAIYKPNASITNGNIVLAAGTKQSLPATGLVLVDVVRNMGNGSTPGNAIRVVAREVLDAQVPDWHNSANATNVVKHYVYSPLDPLKFYVYPYQTGGTYVEAIYGVTPAAVAAVGNAITIDDIYVPALVNYICYRAYSKDAEYAGNAAAAEKYYVQFVGLMTGKTAGELAYNPNVSMGSFNPNVPGAK